MITATAEYALRAATLLAQTDQPLTTAALAESGRIPVKYLSKVMRQLVVAGLVESRRGLGGGFSLLRPAQDISVLAVLDAVGEPLKRIETCPLGIPGHLRECPLHQTLDEAIALLRARFAGVSLRDLLPKRGGAPFSGVTRKRRAR